MFNLSEKELQEKIINLLNEEKITSAISGLDQLKALIDIDGNSDFLPGYQIDFQLKTKYARSAITVIESLAFAEIISGDIIKNISLQKDTTLVKERLYPDVVLASREESTFILIELKKDSQTEREAITELLAYAIELKNHLPNIADSDIHLVIVSPAFNVLLDHSVSSLLLGSKFNVLALKPKMENGQLLFQVHIPNSWTDIWQNTLPPHAFSSVTLTPNECKQEKISQENLSGVEKLRF